MSITGPDEQAGGLPGSQGLALAGRGAEQPRVRNETPLLVTFWLLTLGGFVALLAIDPNVAGGGVAARDARSMLRPANFARALTEVPGRAPGGKVSMLRLQPDKAQIFIDGARNGTSGSSWRPAATRTPSVAGWAGRPLEGWTLRGSTNAPRSGCSTRCGAGAAATGSITWFSCPLARPAGGARSWTASRR